MDFRQINCFVAVAEELHFGRAAARLHMSQPPLSQQIKGLEERLKVQLFTRDRRSVRLTPAGLVFLRHARDVIASSDAGARAALRVASGEEGELRLGYSATALYSDEVLRAIVRYRKRFPGIDLRLAEGTTRTHAADLQADRVDAAFVRGPLPKIVSTWPTSRRVLVARERLVVALPKDHPLAQRRRLTLQDLAGNSQVRFADRLGTALNELLDGLFAASQLRLEVAVETADMASMLGLVGAGAGIAVVPDAVSGQRSRYVAFRPLADRGAVVDLYLLLPPDPGAPAVKLRGELK